MRREKVIDFIRPQLYSVAQRDRLRGRVKRRVPFEKIPLGNGRRLEQGLEFRRAPDLDFLQNDRTVGAEMWEILFVVSRNIDHGEKLSIEILRSKSERGRFITPDQVNEIIRLDAPLTRPIPEIGPDDGVVPLQ